METSIKSYEARLRINNEIKSKFDKLNKKYVDCSEFFFDMWLNLNGLIKPDWVSVSARNSYTPGTKVDEEKGKKAKQEKETEEYSVPVHCFVCWFTLESGDKAPVEYCINPTDIEKRFSEHWRETTGTNPPEDDAVLNLIFESLTEKTKSETSVWVDRFSSGKNYIKNYVKDENDIKRILTSNFYPISQIESDYLTGRSIFSTHLGSGKKKDWDNTLILRASIRDISETAETCQEFFSCLSKICNLNITTKESFFSSMPKSTGRSDKFVLFVDKCEWTNEGIVCDKFEENMEGLREWAEEKMKMTEERTEGKIELYSTLMESFEKKFGIKYNDKGYAEHVAQMCDLSLRRIKSYTKNFYNKIDKRIENCENLKTAKEKEIKNPWLVDALDNYKKITGQPYLYKHQISGFNSTYEKWEENSKQIVETTSKLSFERGDKNFYMYLAKILAEKKLTKSIRYDVYTYFDIDSLKEDRDTVWWNVVRHISIESPEPFSFGNSKPNLDYNLDEKTVTFSFLDEKIPVYFESERIFKELSVKCSNRDCNNCNYTDKEWKCSLCGTLNNKRKHHGLLNNVHFKLTNGGHDVFPERKNQTIAVMPFIRNGNWYVKFSVTFKRNRQKFVDKSKPDLRILALDLGQRKPGYYTIMERCDKEWFYKNGNCCLKIVKHGKLDDLLETYSGKKIDILSDHNVTKKVQGKPEKSTTKFMEDMGNFVENKLKDSVKFLKEMREGNCNFSDDDLIHKCDTILGRNKDNTITIRGQGGLSFSRLDRMDNVIRAISSYVDYRIDNGQAVSNKVNEYLVRLRQTARRKGCAERFPRC